MLTLNDENLRRAVEQYAEGVVPKFIERMEGGVSAEVYRVTLLRPNGTIENIVLRIHGATHCGHAAELEFNILEALFQAGISVPKPLSFDASCSVLENPFLMIAFVEGSSDFVKPMRKATFETMAEALISVQEVPVCLMPTLPRRIDPVPELLEFLPTGSEWKKFRGYLKEIENAPFDGPDVVLHGDFWPANLLWKHGRIAAILDWEDAALGDPLSDVACTSLELQYIHGEAGKVLFEDTYAKHREIDPRRLALWNAYVSSAALKYMAEWGLEPAKEDHMRKTAHDSLLEAATVLL